MPYPYKPSNPGRAGMTWEPWEDEELLGYMSRGFRIKTIAEKMQRTQHSIRCRVDHLKAKEDENAKVDSSHDLRDAMFDNQSRPKLVVNKYTGRIFHLLEFNPHIGPATVYLADMNGLRFSYEFEEFLNVYAVHKDEAVQDESEPKGWYVINFSARMPRHIHKSREEAEKEAERLAIANPGQEFTVLAAGTTFKATQTVTVERY